MNDSVKNPFALMFGSGHLQHILKQPVVPTHRNLLADLPGKQEVVSKTRERVTKPVRVDSTAGSLTKEFRSVLNTEQARTGFPCGRVELYLPSNLQKIYSDVVCRLTPSIPNNEDGQYLLQSVKEFYAVLPDFKASAQLSEVEPYQYGSRTISSLQMQHSIASHQIRACKASTEIKVLTEIEDKKIDGQIYGLLRDKFSVMAIDDVLRRRLGVRTIDRQMVAHILQAIHTLSSPKVE